MSNIQNESQYLGRGEMTPRQKITIGISLLPLAAVLFWGCTSKAVKRETIGLRSDDGGLRVYVSPDSERKFSRIGRAAFHNYVNGLIYEELGNLQSAARSYNEALKQFPSSEVIRLTYAQVLIRLRDLARALEVLEKIENPMAEVTRWRAVTRRMLGDESGAKTEYLYLISMDKDNSEAYSFLAGYYRKAENLDSTIWAYEQLSRVRPESHRFLNELARLYMARGESGKAKQMLRSSLGRNSGENNVTAAASLADLYIAEKKTDSAIAVLEVGLHMEPDNRLINRQVMLLYLQQDSILAAIPYARKLKQLEPDDPVATRRLGVLLLEADSLDLADSILTGLVESGDRSPANHYYLGRVAIGKDQMERARDEFIIVAKNVDTLAASWLDLAFVYRRLDDSAAELKTYQKGLNHVVDDRGRVDLLFALGAAYERSGKVDKALETFEEILAVSPDHAQSLNYLGYMLADRGERLEYALNLISRAVELDPNSGAYLDSYGWVYYRLGNYDLALQYLEQAAQFVTDPVIFDHLGDTYDATGEHDDAREWWQKALELQPENNLIREKLDR